MAYRQMPIEQVKISDLRLDIDNFRIPIKQLNEHAAMNYLFAEHDVRSVASLILRDGYIDNEIPMVTAEGGSYVILEGNRRLSALRALLNPGLVPAHQAELERLLKRFSTEAADLPDKIRVMVFPSRDSAAPVLARLHTGEPKKGWSLDEQAKFVFAQLTDGMTVSDLKNQLPGIKEPVRLIRMGRMRELLTMTKFRDRAIAEYSLSTALKMSSFEYAYRNSDIQSALGISFDDQGNLASRPSTSTHVAALERLLQGFKAGELNTRRGLKPGSEDFKKLIAELRGPIQLADTETENDERSPAEPPTGINTTAPTVTTPDTNTTAPTATTPDTNTTAPTATTPDTNTTAQIETPHPPINGEQRPNPTDRNLPLVDTASPVDNQVHTPPSITPTRGPNNPETRATLDFSVFDEESLPLTLKHRVRELRRIKVQEFPAASAMLMRSVLEASIKEHYTITTDPKVSGTLGDVMKKVTSDYNTDGTLSHAISTINRTKRGSSTTPGTGEWFNLVAHSVNIDVDGTQIHQAWRVIFPLVRFLLQPRARVATP